MGLFRRAKRAPQGSLRLGDHSENAADYNVFTVSESRFPESFAQLWDQASEEERLAKQIRRWAVLTPITDPATKLVAERLLAATLVFPSLAVLAPSVPLAGDEESLRGFRQGVEGTEEATLQQGDCFGKNALAMTYKSIIAPVAQWIERLPSKQ